MTTRGLQRLNLEKFGEETTIQNVRSWVRIFVKSVDGDTLGLLAGGTLGIRNGQDSVVHRGFDVLRLNDARKPTAFLVKPSSVPWYPQEA